MAIAVRDASRLAPVFGLILAATAGSAAQANELHYDLSLSVPVACNVISVEQQQSATGVTYRVGASCNADYFRLHVDGDLGQFPISTATSSSAAAVNVIGNDLLITPRAPGAFYFDINYGDDAKGAHSIAFGIDAV